MALSETAELQRGAQRFLRAAMKKPMLEADHERELARQWRDERDEHALHETTMAYMASSRGRQLPPTEAARSANGHPIWG